MKVVHTFHDFRRWAADASVGLGGAGRLGLTPTMGALHPGHLAHIPALRAAGADAVAVSIFVNPTQFGPDEDLSRYPRPLDADLAACAAAGVDAVFHPDPHEVYPPDEPPLHVDVPDLTGTLEGADRPGHFVGVCRVVLKLLGGLLPDLASFGAKDFQQLAVVRAMVRGAALPVGLVPVPVVREPDGLARSSRNAYLTPDQRKSALALHAALQAARSAFTGGERRPAALEAAMAERLAAADALEPVYTVVRDPVTLREPDRVAPDTRALIAARVGPTRLIDNAPLSG